MRIQRVAGMMVVLFLVFLVGTSQAKQREEKVAVTVKEVIGEVTWVSERYIAIVYERDKEKGVENEILLPIENDIKIVHKKSLKQLNVGDIVRIEYEEVSCESKEGTKTNRKAKMISFVRAAREESQPVESQEVSLSIEGTIKDMER